MKNLIKPLLLAYLLLCIPPLAQAQMPVMGTHSIFLPGDDYIYIQNQSALDLSNTMSIEAWINVCDLQAGPRIQMIASKQDCQDQDFSWYFGVKDDGALIFTWSDDGYCSSAGPGVGVSYITSVPGLISNGTWAHVAITWAQNGTPVLYVDGDDVSSFLVGSTVGGINLSSENVYLGAYKAFGGQPTNYFRGLMDEFRIWNSERSPGQIAANFNDELTGSPSDLICYYQFNEYANLPGSYLYRFPQLADPSNSNVLDALYMDAPGTTGRGYVVPNPLEICVCSNAQGNGNRSARDLGIADELLTENELTVVPNPSHGRIQLSWLNAAQECEGYSVFDLQGRMVHQAPGLKNNTEVHLPQLSPGSYIIVLQFEDGNTLNKHVLLR